MKIYPSWFKKMTITPTKENMFMGLSDYALIIGSYVVLVGWALVLLAWG